MYLVNLYEVPTEMPLASYLQRFGNVPVRILDQGKEGACTGFGLAAVVNALPTWRRVVPDPAPVSAWMLDEMAKRYDEWPGERYEGSSARGAMKGWHKHGVCTNVSWPYSTRKKTECLTAERARECLHRPLGAYYRLNHKDLVSARGDGGGRRAVRPPPCTADGTTSGPMASSGTRSPCREAMPSPSWATTSRGSESRTPGATTGDAGASRA